MRKRNPLHTLWAALATIAIALAGLSTSHSLVLGAASVELAGQGELGTNGQDQTCVRAEEFREIKGQGHSCKLPNGYWKVKLRDGSTIITHGPDSAEEAMAVVDDSEGLIASSHACVPTTDYHGLIIYAQPSDKPDRYDTMVNTIRNYFQGAQDRLNTDAMRFGVSASYKMACDADGRVTIKKAKVGSSSGASFSSIVSDLKALGYNSSKAKYWIWYDASIIACGQGDVKTDESASANNRNNFGPSYGISYNCNAMMHENGHNLGAVQYNAPNSSGAWHCNDGLDVMCYGDGGPKSRYSSSVCSTRYYDCNNNDYFHPNPPSGNYLYNHWNIGACYNNYIVRSGCNGTTPTPVTTTPVTRTPTPVTTTPNPGTVFSDNFETEKGWTRNPNGSDTATLGTWERGDPEATDYNGPKQLGTTASGSNDLVTGRMAGSGAGDYDLDGGVSSIRSPSISLPSSGNLTLSFRYYLAHASNASSADYLRVKIVGASTTTVFEKLGAASDVDASWQSATVNLSSYAGQTIRILIEAADASTGSLLEAAVDDVVVSAN